MPVEANKRLFILIFFGCSSSLICFLDNSSDNKSNIVENLKKLNDLYKSGVLTKEEFEKAKKKLLN